ncbi:MAG: PleD family two-component system response regulator [Candidatus Zixiibacteriota bacterium]
MGDKLEKDIGTILVIDDEEIITDLIQNILSKEGYQVHKANDGINGEKLAKELRPDLILMDITMPGMNGYKVTERIKSNPELKDIPVIFLTGKSPNEDGGKAFAVGGVTYMVKPFTNQQLKDLVRLAIESVITKDIKS